MKIFGNFFGKNVKFLAIFEQSNGNFPEGQISTDTPFVDSCTFEFTVNINN